MELNEIRQKIDQLNGELLRLFEERMKLCAQVAEEKQKNGSDIFVPAREVEILNQVREKASPELADYAVSFFNGLMSLSRQYQAQLLHLAMPAGGVPSGIQTEHLEFIPLDVTAVPAVYSLTSDPEIVHYMRFAPHTRPEQTDAWVQELTSGRNLGYTVLKKDGAFVGIFALKPDVQDLQTWNMTILLDKKYWGQGFCGEILQMAQNMGRDILRAKSLQAYVMAENTASRKALEKAGFMICREFEVANGSLFIYQYLIS